MPKGSNYERDFCKRLSLWWTDGERDDIFWRTGGSGGRATVRQQRGQKTYNQYGDICATDPIGDPLMKVLTFELKRGYTKNNIMDLVDRPKVCVQQKWEEWLQQAHGSHIAAGSFAPIIVFKRDQKQEMVVTTNLLIKHLQAYGNVLTCPIPFVSLVVPVRFKLGKSTLETHTMRLSMMRLEHFFATVTAKDLKRAIPNET